MNRHVAIIAAVGASLAACRGIEAATSWEWEYERPGVVARGVFTTDDEPDADGYHTITAISGTRNGVKIVGLQKTDTPIPGNEPYRVDNRVRRISAPAGKGATATNDSSAAQLTGEGVGYTLADGSHANVFFAEFLDPPGPLEVYSAAPFVPGAVNLGAEDSELPVRFSAEPAVRPTQDDSDRPE